jgi:hypothetical protein
VDKRFERLEERVDENSRGIRYNGMLIEQMRDDISLIREGDHSLQELHAKVDTIFEIVSTEIPVIKNAILSHEKRITALEVKCG